jgi:predicted AlkP superfamily phosphohydrolase/phosphomutase
MRSIKVTFNNGDCIYTRINGTRDQIRRYYFENIFHHWYQLLDKEVALTCTAIDFLDTDSGVDDAQA